MQRLNMDRCSLNASKYKAGYISKDLSCLLIKELESFDVKHRIAKREYIVLFW